VEFPLLPSTLNELRSTFARGAVANQAAEKHPLNLIRFVPAEGKRRPRSFGRALCERNEDAMNHPLPLNGAENPSSRRDGTNPGSFALRGNVGGPLAFASPDTPGMPAPSDKTARDFLPEGWRREGAFAVAPAGFVPVTQLEHARLGLITEEMRRVAERERHLTPSKCATRWPRGA
jgi:hypothetical protein